MRLALAVTTFQVVAGLMSASVFWGLVGPRSGQAALFGMLIAAIPGFYFALRVLRPAPGEAPKTTVRRFYRGEMGKYGLTVVMFLLAVQWFPGQMLSLLLTYMLCLSVYWLALVIN